MSAVVEQPPYFFTGDRAPATAKLLGWRFETCDEDAGTITIAFEAKPEFTNPAGDVQGGILAAMLDDALGPAVLVKSRGAAYAPTLNMNLQFLKPVKPGPVRVEARCLQLGRTIAYMDGVLFNSDGDVAVTATATSRVIPLEKVRTR